MPYRYAKIFEGQIIEILSFAKERTPQDAVMAPHPTKPHICPITLIKPDFDEAIEVQEGPIFSIGESSVTETWTNRPKNSEELAQLRNYKIAALDNWFKKKCAEPISYLGYDWHADDYAIQNIMGVVSMIVAGVPVPNPRPWTPKGSFSPIDMSHAQLIGLGAAIATRKDTLYATKKAKEAEILALESALEINAYNVTTDW